MTILALHPGAAYHCEALEAPRYSRFFDSLIRPEAISADLVDQYELLLVPCRTPAHRVSPHAGLLRSFLDRGGTVVAMGETGHAAWLPAVSFKPLPTNWWWWLEPGADLGLKLPRPEHRLFQRLGPKDVAWHLHGSFLPPSGASSLIDDSEGRSILYVDEATTRGRIIVTSLDPFYHHGSHFMPATTRFLDGFLPWLKEDLRPVSLSQGVGP